jgi:hypothetical protein
MPTFIKADGDASGSNRIGLGRPLDAVRRRLPERVRKDDPTSQHRFPAPWAVEEFAIAPKVNFVIGVTSQTAKFRE